jgi:hypothetical protein
MVRGHVDSIQLIAYGDSEDRKSTLQVAHSCMHFDVDVPIECSRLLRKDDNFTIGNA